MPPSIGSNVEGDEDATRLWRIYESVSKNLERENALINFRITWALVLSAGILAAEGLLLALGKEFFKDAQEGQLFVTALTLALSTLAAFFCRKSYLGVIAAQDQMTEVKQSYLAYEQLFKNLGYPQPFGGSAVRVTGRAAAISFPRSLMILWCVFALMQLFRCGSLWNDVADNVFKKLHPTIDIVKQNDEIKNLARSIEEIQKRLPPVKSGK